MKKSVQSYLSVFASIQTVVGTSVLSSGFTQRRVVQTCYGEIISFVEVASMRFFKRKNL